MNWSEKRVVVTGGTGFLGSHIADELRERGCQHVFVPHLYDFDLRSRDNTRAMYYTFKPHIVINTAASVGGIRWNQKNPAVALHDNLMIGLNLLEESRFNKVEKFVQIGSVCAYPAWSWTPTPETALWDGLPEKTNAPYGIAKRVLSAACQAYREQYGLNAISLLPTNLYGPRDNFNLETCHVIPAMIRKFVEAQNAGARQVTFWGSGEATREFLYVEDCAEAVILATEQYDKPEPVNLGKGRETSIGWLAQIIQEQVGFSGEVLWDETKPDGQHRRLFDISKARDEFGFTAQTDLVDGLYDTIEWYRDNICDISR
jgi:GDP-L-fucose synthase